jgi:hypothetical protein
MILSQAKLSSTNPKGLSTPSQRLFDYSTTISAAIISFVYSLGGSLRDLNLIWFSDSDLLGWYLRSLAFTTEGAPSFTRGLNYPSEFHSTWGWIAFDLLHVAIQFLFSELGVSPIPSTNILILLMVGLTAGSTLFVLHKLRVHRLLSIVGGFLVATVPFTLLRPYHINAGFAWPYVLCCVVALGIAGIICLRSWSYLTLGVAIGASGSYAIVYCLICIGVVFVVALLRNHSGVRRLTKNFSYFLLGVVTSLGLYMALLSIWTPTNPNLDIYNFRDPSEARLWQGWMISNLVPGPISGIPIFDSIAEGFNNWLFVALDPTRLCPPDWSVQGTLAKWGCLRLVESHSFNSMASFFGNWLIVAAIVSAVSSSYRETSSKEHSKFELGFMARNPSTSTIILIWFTVIVTYSFGVGLLVARVFPGARTWGRMSLVATVCSILVLVIFLNEKVQLNRAWSTKNFALGAFLLLVVCDQVNYNLDALALTRAEQLKYSDFASGIQERYSEGCAIAQFPALRYTTGLSKFDLEYSVSSDYFLSLYLPKLRWSAGPLTERFGEPWPPRSGPFEAVSDRQAYFEQFVGTALTLGVCGFVIDRTPGSGVTEWDETFIRSELNRLGLQYEVVRRSDLTSLHITAVNQGQD